MSDDNPNKNDQSHVLADDIDLSFDAFNPVRKPDLPQAANPAVAPAKNMSADTASHQATTAQPAVPATAVPPVQDEGYAAMEKMLASSGNKSKTGFERKILEFKNKRIINVKKLLMFTTVGMAIFIMVAFGILTPRIFKRQDLPNLMNSLGIFLENIKVAKFSSNLIVFEDIRPEKSKGWGLKSLAIEKPSGDLEDTREFRKIVIDGLNINGSFENFLMSEGVNEIILMLFDREGRNKLHMQEIVIKNVLINTGGGIIVFNGQGELAKGRLVVKGSFSGQFGDVYPKGTLEVMFARRATNVSVEVERTDFQNDPSKQHRFSGVFDAELQGKSVRMIKGDFQYKNNLSNLKIAFTGNPQEKGISLSGAVETQEVKEPTIVKFEIPRLELSGDFQKSLADMPVNVTVNAFQANGFYFHDVSFASTDGQVRCAAGQCGYYISKPAELKARGFLKSYKDIMISGDVFGMTIAASEDSPVFLYDKGSIGGQMPLGRIDISGVVRNGTAFTLAGQSGELTYLFLPKFSDFTRVQARSLGSTFSTRDFELSGADIGFDLNENGQTNFEIESAPNTVQLAGDIPIITPFRTRLQMKSTNENGVFSLAWVGRTLNDAAFLSFVGNADLSQRTIYGQFKLNRMEFQQAGAQIKDTFPRMGDYLFNTNGSLSAKGDVAISPDGITGPLQVYIQDFSTAISGASIVCANGVITLSKVRPLKTDAPQNLHISWFDAGIPLSDVLLQFSLDESATINKGTAKIGNSTLSLAEENKINIITTPYFYLNGAARFKGRVAIADMLKNLVFSDTGSQGSANSAIDIGFGSDGAYLTRATVNTGKEPGRIAVVDNSLRAANVMAGSNALEQFRDLPFSVLTGTLRGKRGHGMDLEIKVTGKRSASVVERGLELDKFRVLEMTPLPVPLDIQEEIHNFK